MKKVELEDAILDLFVKNRITVDIAKASCWQLLAALYENELIEESHPRGNHFKHREAEGINLT
jgi:hypothetical protein